MDNNYCNKSGKWGAVRAKTNKSKVNELLNKCCKQLYGKMQSKSIDNKGNWGKPKDTSKC